jgi:hypothetical protein
LSSANPSLAISKGLADIARHVIGNHSAQGTRAHAQDDEAGIVCQALPAPARPIAPCPAKACWWKFQGQMRCVMVLFQSTTTSKRVRRGGLEC